MRCPGGVEQSDGLGEDVIVDESSVHGEDSHQQNDVSPSKEHVENLQKQTAINTMTYHPPKNMSKIYTNK
jgi:hypothetical protein